MKSFKEFLAEARTNNYEVGVSVKFDHTKVSTYLDVDKLAGFDYGKVVAVKGSSYDLELPNNLVVTVKADDIISYGNADAD